MSQKSKSKTKTTDYENGPGGSGDGHHSSDENRESREGHNSLDVLSVSRGTTSGITKVDMELLVDYLSRCINSDGTISFEYYIKMFWEMNRFFELLGTVFQFVSKDVVAKLLILEDYQKSKHASHYVTIDSMINYERKKNLLRKTTPPLSGSRTLLRLHRALEFIIVFLTKANSAKEDEKMCPHAQEAYNNTLAAFHPWLIKKAANVAMYTLPYKKDLMEQTCKQTKEKLTSLVAEVVDKSRKVYNVVQSLYVKHVILDLP
uniref:Glycolipid transfer protein domain-containing protein n=1 Tax=Strigamia maritima TaxID=126957 RepID=T1JLX1_STRMM